MKSDLSAVQVLALNLSLSDRANLAEKLLESLEVNDDFQISDIWIQECNRRVNEIESGQSTVAAEDAFEKLRDMNS